MSSPRVIVVTGASVGIGSAILRQQASLGHIVVGLARRAEKIEVSFCTKFYFYAFFKTFFFLFQPLQEQFNTIGTYYKICT